jgi:putative tryptophan/tyrosine transport system substrate-binding protein
MKRREFIAGFGSAAAWPVAVRAQQRQRMRRIGVLNAFAADDQEGRRRVAAFLQALQPLGWTVGRNVEMEHRWGSGDPAGMRKNAEELVALAPDVILTTGAAGVAPLVQATRSVPIVFVLVADPVGAGFVDSLAHPGGNATGFISIEYGFGGKWLELLKEIAPSVTRAAIVRDPTISAGLGMFGAIPSVAPSLGVDVIPVNVRDPGEIERALAQFAHAGRGGLIVTPSALAFTHRDLLVSLAAQHKLPAVYYTLPFVQSGGLASYGVEIIDQYHCAAGYVDRILKGEKPANLPVQAPTKYELAINLKTAKPLGLDVPLTLIARADEVIE